MAQEAALRREAHTGELRHLPRSRAIPRPDGGRRPQHHVDEPPAPIGTFLHAPCRVVLAIADAVGRALLRLEETDDLLLGRHRLAQEHAPLRSVDHGPDEPGRLLERVGQPEGGRSFVPLHLLQVVDRALRVAGRPARHLEQVAVGVLARFVALRVPHRQAAPLRSLRVVAPLPVAERLAGVAQQSSQHPHPVVEQRRIRRRVDERLRHGRPRAHLLAGLHPERHGVAHEAAVDLLQRLPGELLQVLRQGRAVRRRIERLAAAETAVRHRIRQVKRQRLVAETVHLLDERNAEPLIPGEPPRPRLRVSEPTRQALRNPLRHARMPVQDVVDLLERGEFLRHAR